jgi:hypothetical protein
MRSQGHEMTDEENNIVIYISWWKFEWTYVEINSFHLLSLTGFFLCPRIESSGAYSFWPVRLFVCKNFNIGHMFWMASDRAFIFHMCVPYDKIFLLVPNVLTFWPWKFDPLFKNFNIGHIFWIASDRDFICVILMTRLFYCSKFCDFDLEVWPIFQKF